MDELQIGQTVQVFSDDCDTLHIGRIGRIVDVQTDDDDIPVYVVRMNRDRAVEFCYEDDLILA